MNRRRFGEFLVEKQVITASALVEALKHQRGQWGVGLEELAVKHKMLKPEQLLEVLDAQESVDERFEDIVLYLSYLSQDQLDFLSEKRDEDQKLIGEILVEQGRLTRKELDKLLIDYSKI